MKGYTAYNLNIETRRKLLEKFPPKFSKVIAHHITHKFGVAPDILFQVPKKVEIVGYASDEFLEALVVEVDGTMKRFDGGTYHITLSLDLNERKPVDSNKLIKRNRDWKPIERFQIDVTPMFNAFKELIVLVGPQGAGKSTFCKEHLPNYFRVSQDDMGSKGHRIRFQEALKVENFIVIDRINHIQRQRDRYLGPAKELGFYTKILKFDYPYQVCFNRIKSRTFHPTLKNKDDGIIHRALNMYFKGLQNPLSTESDALIQMGD